MSKSVLYAGNSIEQTVTTAGGVVDFGKIIKRYGCNVNLSGGNAVVEGYGYYKVDVNLTFLTTEAGMLNVQLYKDGVAIPNASQTLSVLDATTHGLNIPAVIRQTCCCEAVITAEISGVSGNIENAAIIVEKM